MATTTVDLVASATAYTDYTAPTTSFYNTQSIVLREDNRYYSYSTIAVLNFDLSIESKKKHITDAQLFFYVSSFTPYSPTWIITKAGSEGYDISNLTYALNGGMSTNPNPSYEDPEAIKTNISSTGSKSTTRFNSTIGGQFVFWNCIRSQSYIQLELGTETQWGSYDIPNVISGISGSSAPYLRVYLEDPTFSVGSLNPGSGWINRKSPQIFQWNTSTNASGGIGVFTRTGSKLEWKTTDEETIYTITQEGSARQITVPADTFPSAQIQIRITDQLEEVGSITSSWYTLTTVDSIPTATIVSPKSVYIDGSISNDFTWNHIITTGTPQSKYELEYSTDDGVSWEQVSAETTSQTSVTFPPNTFPSGSMLWRVRTANQDEVFGEWSEPATVIVRAAPDPPIISPVGSEPMPTIRWQADDQQAVEIEIDGKLEASVYGTDKSYTLKRFLEDGDHVVSIRVQNRFGLWSEWSTADFQTLNVPGGTVELSFEPIENGVLLIWGGPSATYWVERDGERIAQVSGNSYADYTTVGEHTYRVRAVMEGGHYSISNEVIATSSVRYAVISKVDPISFISLEKRRGVYPSHIDTIESLTTFNHYSGRSLPVAEISEHKTIRHQLDFSFKIPKESYALNQLLGETILYKDCLGACFIGVLSMIDRTTDVASDVTLTIIETGS